MGEGVMCRLARGGREGRVAMEQKLGTVQVSPSVLATLARLTAAGVPGVARVGGERPSWLKWLPRWRAAGPGVRLQVLPDGVHVELELVVQQGHNMLDVASRVQQQVSEAFEKMVGMAVREVNVHIQDVQ